MKYCLNHAFVNEVAETSLFLVLQEFYSLNQAFVNEVAETFLESKSELSWFEPSLCKRSRRNFVV